MGYLQNAKKPTPHRWDRLQDEQIWGENGSQTRGRLRSGQMDVILVELLLHQTSMSFYGRRTMRLNLPGVSALTQAQYIADFELLRRKQPRGEVSAMTLVSHGKNGGSYHAQQLALTLGDSIAISESQTGHNRKYFIIGEAHKLLQGATRFETTWYLEPAPDTVVVGGTNINPYAWEVEDNVHGKLGETSYLTY